MRKYASFDTSPQIGDSEIVLTAKSKDTGKQLAKAVCIVDRNNVVLSLKVIALRRTRQF